MDGSFGVHSYIHAGPNGHGTGIIHSIATSTVRPKANTLTI